MRKSKYSECFEESGYDSLISGSREGTPAKQRKSEHATSQIPSTSNQYPPALLDSSQLNRNGLIRRNESDLHEFNGYSGRIEKVQMTNFMCHSNLEIPFNKRINFITGRNGSGKSAVIAALVIALGGNASLTGRGTSIADFIKKGESSAKVSITLINDGMNSYKKRDYGPRITITRNFTQTGANSYVCKSHTGQVIAKKKEEVDKIRITFNLQIKNPVCILNQDTARNFLSSSDNGLMYTIFMKATQLEELRQLYDETCDLLEESVTGLKEKKGNFNLAKEEIAGLKKKLEQLAALEETSKKRTNLENELFWSMVIVEENELEKLSKEMSNLELKKEELLTSQTKCSGGYNEDIQDIEQKIEVLNEKRGEIYNRDKDTQEEVDVIQRNINNLENLRRQIVNKNDRQEAEINLVREHIAQSEASSNERNEERARLKNELSELELKLVEVKDRLSVAKHDCENSNDTLRQKKECEESTTELISDLQRKRNHLQRQLEGLQSHDDISLVKFGNYVPKLLQAIEQADQRKQFIKKPIGPCGLYVSYIGDVRWAAAVESNVGPLLRAFCCDNEKDSAVLTRLMDNVCGDSHPAIITSKYLDKRHDIRRNLVTVPGYNSILDLLRFDNSVVFNALIDQLCLESTLLIETDDQASSLMSDIRRVPKNLRLGITIQGDQYYPAPNYRTYCAKNLQLRYFDTNSNREDRISKLEVQVREVGQELNKAKSEVDKVKEEIRRMNEFSKKSLSHLRNLREQESQLSRRIREMKDEEETQPVLATREALEEELKQLVQTHNQTAAKLEQVKKDMDSFKDRLVKCKEKSQSLNQEEVSCNEEYNRMKDRLAELKNKQKHEQHRQSTLKTRLNDVNKLVEDKMKQVQNKEKDVKKKIDEATEVCCERVQTDRTPRVVQGELDKIEQYIKAAERISGSRKETIAEFKTKSERFNSIKHSLKIRENMIKTFSEAVILKNEKFRFILSKTAQLICRYFQASLLTRGYDGKLSFDFQDCKLDLEVQPKNESEARKDTKTLSGGERSYSTVSFILAIWQAIQMPFYFLDEFDVFMDKVNRKIIMDLLLENAKEKSNMQFVFITPQDITEITQDDITSVFQMPDPERKRL